MTSRTTPQPKPKSQDSPPTPFLKWAGGKRALLGEIVPRIPNFAGTYIEPFLGAGALMFTQETSKKKIVNDFNQDLIEVYEVIRDEPAKLISTLKTHKNTKEHFLKVRAWDREPNFKTKRTKVERAARIIFLNKTCFNGLYRVNSQGFFNVPFGDCKKPDWIAESNILRVSKFLSHKSRVSFSTRLLSGDYRQASKLAKPGDFVYFDPPYDPASNTSSFVSYQSGGFTSANQEELRDEILRLTKLGVPVILSNSDTKLIGGLYGDKAIFTISRVKVNRAISAKVSGRVAVGEVLVDNFKKIKSIGAK